ncbi:amino acid/amide ABC transporter ATP-binding protein 1, HAAT family [Rhizobiales bacterium GAS191]|nr:amino acid/amide ABC transporter ATP-binding protein 1, HAAT family [Rhizobiales bacterium GAS113]SED98788.1 amino acid/amide ABC transporter ATP-binding protein 1, HAAT family [Rhizobiales bacterium GAS191]SEE49932.1 amino acid/amide ABC transporter ATP-binding protein 1, HAAT family [Rhizobiales bacterium GAS188]
MAEPVLRVDNLVKRFGGITATDHLSLEIGEGEFHAIIGPNGAGKTTLLAQLSGELQPTSGRIAFRGADITALSMPARSQRGIARSFQINTLCRDFTALDNVALAVQAHQGHSFRFWRPAQEDARLREPALRVLDEVGLAKRADIPAGHLAHGEQRQLEMALALATKPRLLLLDEPMAGMGAEDSAAMVELLSRLKSSYTILLIEHDMDAVFALADRITVLVYGRAIATGTADAVQADPEVQRAYLGEDHVDA